MYPPHSDSCLPVDVNECRGGTHNCSRGDFCVNSEGSYRCVRLNEMCDEGFIHNVNRQCVGKRTATGRKQRCGLISNPSQLPKGKILVCQALKHTDTHVCVGQNTHTHTHTCCSHTALLVHLTESYLSEQRNFMLPLTNEVGMKSSQRQNIKCSCPQVGICLWFGSVLWFPVLKRKLFGCWVGLF